MKPEKLEKDDLILFNDRSTPLTVEKEIDDGVIVEGPQGGEYELYTDEGTDLISKKGKRRYSSYANEIRKVGKWIREEQRTWKHSKTEAVIQLEKNSAGFFEIKSSGINIDQVDQPKYGYSDIEFAEEDVQKLIKKNPEGE